MGEAQDDKDWRRAIGGWLIALAVVVAAVGGFVAMLFQFGILGGKRDSVRATASLPAPPPPTVAAPAPPAAAPSAFANPIPPVGQRRWSETEAVVRTRDGMVNRLRASSLGHCSPGAHDFSLDNGKSIPFERMAGFEVHHADPHGSPDAKARLLVEMLDGQQVQATVAAACELSGEGMEGRFVAHLEAIRSVRFER